jgi:hypothetical protein
VPSFFHLCVYILFFKKYIETKRKGPESVLQRHRQWNAKVEVSLGATESFWRHH